MKMRIKISRKKANRKNPKKTDWKKNQDDISDTMKVDAESILDEEKKNKERRRAKDSGKIQRRGQGLVNMRKCIFILLTHSICHQFDRK